MIEWQKPKSRPLLRTVAFLTAFTFTVTSVTWADPSSASSSRSPENKIPDAGLTGNFQQKFLDSISLPESIGQIKKSFQGSRDRIVIHIQDAHVNEEAQR